MALTIGPCRVCGVDTIAGLTNGGRALALDVTLDATPLDPRGELEAAVAGCRTYTHHVVPGVLHVRSGRTIRQRPAGSQPRQTVHREHVCIPRGRTTP